MTNGSQRQYSFYLQRAKRRHPKKSEKEIAAIASEALSASLIARGEKSHSTQGKRLEATKNDKKSHKKASKPKTNPQEHRRESRLNPAMFNSIYQKLYNPAGPLPLPRCKEDGAYSYLKTSTQHVATATVPAGRSALITPSPYSSNGFNLWVFDGTQSALDDNGVDVLSQQVPISELVHINNPALGWNVHYSGHSINHVQTTERSKDGDPRVALGVLSGIYAQQVDGGRLACSVAPGQFSDCIVYTGSASMQDLSEGELVPKELTLMNCASGTIMEDGTKAEWTPIPDRPPSVDILVKDSADGDALNTIRGPFDTHNSNVTAVRHRTPTFNSTPGSKAARFSSINQVTKQKVFEIPVEPTPRNTMHAVSLADGSNFSELHYNTTNSNVGPTATKGYATNAGKWFTSAPNFGGTALPTPPLACTGAPVWGNPFNDMALGQGWIYVDNTGGEPVNLLVTQSLTCTTLVDPKKVPNASLVQRNEGTVAPPNAIDPKASFAVRVWERLPGKKSPSPASMRTSTDSERDGTAFAPFIGLANRLGETLSPFADKALEFGTNKVMDHLGKALKQQFPTLIGAPDIMTSPYMADVGISSEELPLAMALAM